MECQLEEPIYVSNNVKQYNDIDNADWIGNLEHDCNYFNLNPKSIKLTFIYITKGNNINHIKKGKIDLDENSTLTKDKLIEILNKPEYKIVGLFKCDTKISIQDIKNYKVNFSFVKDLKKIKDETWNETCNVVESLNDLVILFKTKMNKQTKKAKSKKPNKTKKNYEVLS